MLFRLGAKVVHIDIAARVAADHHDLHSRHMRRRRIGAVGGRGDQADLAMTFAP